MPNLQVVSRERYGNKRWKRYSSYAFAATDAMAPLVLQELPKACMSLPLAFAASGDEFVPVAVQGFAANVNLLVGADGRWVGRYTPALYRGHPFALAKTEDGREVLCFNEDSGLLSDDGEGEAFFSENGDAAPDVKRVLDFLGKLSAQRALTQQVCQVLKQHELIEPWPVQVKDNAGEHAIAGLYRISEARLNAMAPEALDAVRKAGGLAAAYCQLLSMQHLAALGRLLEQRAAANTTTLAPEGELDLEFLNDSDTIRFS